MSDLVLVALIAGIFSAIPPTTLGILNYMLNRKNSQKLDGVLEDRVQAATQVGKAEGHAQGVVDQKATQGTARRKDEK